MHIENDIVEYITDKTISIDRSKLDLKPRTYPKIIYLQEDEYYYDGVITHVDHNYITNHQIKNIKYKSNKGVELLINLNN